MKDRWKNFNKEFHKYNIRESTLELHIYISFIMSSMDKLVPRNFEQTFDAVASLKFESRSKSLSQSRFAPFKFPLLSRIEENIIHFQSEDSSDSLYRKQNLEKECIDSIEKQIFYGLLFSIISFEITNESLLTFQPL